MLMSCNPQPKISNYTFNKPKNVYMHCAEDKNKLLFGRRKSLEIDQDTGMEDAIRVVDIQMHSVEFASPQDSNLSNCSFAASESSDCNFSSAVSDSSEFCNEQINCVAMHSCPIPAKYTLRPIDSENTLLMAPQFVSFKSAPITDSNRACSPHPIGISESRSCNLPPGNSSIRCTSAPPPETGIPRVWSSVLEEGYYVRSPEGIMKPVDVFSSDGMIVKTTEGKIFTTPRLTPCMSREMSMTSNASSISSPSGSSFSDGHPMLPLLLPPSPRSQDGSMVHGEFVQVVPDSPSFYASTGNPVTPQRDPQVTKSTDNMPGKLAGPVAPPLRRNIVSPPFYNQPAFLAPPPQLPYYVLPSVQPQPHEFPKLPAPTSNQHGTCNSLSKLPVRNTNLGITSKHNHAQPKIGNIQSKINKKKSHAHQKKPTELGPPVDRPSIVTDGVTIKAEDERELREMYETIEVGEWNHPVSQKPTLCLVGLGRHVKMGHVKPVIKAMGGMTRARDISITIPLNETSPEMKILEMWNEMKEKGDKIGIERLALVHGFKPDKGVRVPTHGFAYLTFNGIAGKRNAQRVHDIVNKCDKGDIKYLRCVWNPPSNSVTGKGRPDFLGVLDE